MSPADQQRFTERQTRISEIYSPQIQNLEQQITSLPSMYEAQKSSLQQAKENAFRDITKQASRGGMLFTGFTPKEEARYLGEKYLPGLQQLTSQENAARLGLLGQIANLRGQERAAGLSYLDYLEQLRRADEQAARARAAGISDMQSLYDQLNKDNQNEPTTTGELDPEYDSVRSQIEKTKSFGRLQDRELLKLINVQKRFVLKTGGSRNATPEAQRIARNRLNIYRQILGEAKYKSLGGI